MVENPTDPLAWAGLAGDVVDLIPGVTGVGETVKAVNATKKAVNTVDTIVDGVKVTDKATDTIKTARRIHGNSLASSKTNYGYVLLDQERNILKFGETIHPSTRYSKKSLESKKWTMVILEEGNKLEIHNWQHDMNMYYKYKYGSFPPENKKGW